MAITRPGHDKGWKHNETYLLSFLDRIPGDLGHGVWRRNAYPATRDADDDRARDPDASNHAADCHIHTDGHGESHYLGNCDCHCDRYANQRARNTTTRCLGDATRKRDPAKTTSAAWSDCVSLE